MWGYSDNDSIECYNRNVLKDDLFIDTHWTRIKRHWEKESSSNETNVQKKY
jgi:hypothetical protein